MATPLLEHLAPLVARLPFPLDDTGAVNALFMRWRATKGDGDLATIQLWAYCYYRRYFTVKFVREGIGDAPELEAVISKAYDRLCKHLDEVRQPERFNHWASVICRNTLLNFLRRHRTHGRLKEEGVPDPTPSGSDEIDRQIVIEALQRAISSLSPTLRDVARLRLLEGRSYEEVSAATGLSCPTARVYAARALQRLREDAGLRQLWAELGETEEDFVPP